jgi:guanylate kinase
MMPYQSTSSINPLVINVRLQLIITEKPQIVYVSSKTSVGKSTFAKNLKAKLNFIVLGLDSLVYESVINPLNLQDSQQAFIEAYRQRTELAWINRFITETRKEVSYSISEGKNIVLDGAIAHPQTIKELLKGLEVLFIYFHPESLENYYEFLLNRFLGTSRNYQNELPLMFWSQFSSIELTEYYKDRQINDAIKDSIRRYSILSHNESVQRLAT